MRHLLVVCLLLSACNAPGPECLRRKPGPPPSATPSSAPPGSRPPGAQEPDAGGIVIPPGTTPGAGAGSGDYP